MSSHAYKYFTPPSKNDKSKKQSSSSSTLLTAVPKYNMLTIAILLSTVFTFFMGGIYVGSHLAVTSDAAAAAVNSTYRMGIPGTNNNRNKWVEKQVEEGTIVKDSSSNVSATDKEQVDTIKNLRVREVPVIATTTAAKTAATDERIPAVIAPEVIAPVAVTNPTEEPSFVASYVPPLVEEAFFASLKMSALIEANEKLENDNIIISAFVNLKDGPEYDGDMRTIFSNKRSGCSAGDDTYGLAMYVNGWQTSDHKLYVEYGSALSGCNKIDSNSFTIQSDQWYHVAVMFHLHTIVLFIDGVKVNELSLNVSNRRIKQGARGLYIGVYEENAYPFNGYISNVAIVHENNDDHFDDSIINNLRDMTDISHIKGLHALYKLDDYPTTSTKGTQSKAGTESKCSDSIHNYDGTYTLPQVAMLMSGVPIKLVDGIGNREVTQAMMDASDDLGRRRKESIKEGMQHAWSGYKKYAWGYDEVKPISRKGVDNWGGMGVTLVDSLDTLWIMGMKEEFQEARNWVASSLSFGRASKVSVFETTIRELGGLLSAYDLSKDEVFLTKAKQLGDLLLPAFNTNSGIPYGTIDFRSRTGSGGWAGNSAILSELGTLQLEFRYLSHHTHERNYELKCMKALHLMYQKKPKYGLYPIKVSINDGSFTDSQITLGALGDSFYEYLLKVWLQGGKKETWLREMYDNAIDGVIGKLLQTSKQTGLAFLADMNNERIKRKMDHLVCFMPGVLALGAYTNPDGLESVRSQRDLSVAKALMYTCYQMYARQVTKISPEYVEFPENGDMSIGSTAPFYILRPETAESLFVLNQLTGEPKYREWAWEIYEAIDKNCRTDTAYGALRRVDQKSGGVDDRMESFFLAETMKYLYLAQDPDKPIDLMKMVFNTEAHPLTILNDHQVV